MTRMIPLSPARAMSVDGGNENEDEEKLPLSGSFFNIVPPEKDDSPEGPNGFPEAPKPKSEIKFSSSTPFSGDPGGMFDEIIQKTKLNKNISGMGFSKRTSTIDHTAPSIIQTTQEDSSGKKSTFIGIGKPLNDVRNPEYDENGYTLYADETTGERKRVFEALVEYPSIFKMKIVGKDDVNESFAPDVVQIVANSCGVDTSMVKHSKRKNGQWTSVTVHAPVKNADMLYALYENVDRDPRVKFKF